MIDVPKRIISLFEELIARGEEIKNTCKKLSFSANKKTIDPQAYETWKTSCLTLLRSTFGTSSPHYDSFSNVKFFDYYNSTLIYLGILQSAKDDVQKGYFYHKDLMLSVNIFTSFLTRAKAYEDKGSHEKAQALLETVAFESLKKLAESRRFSLTRADSLSSSAKELVESGSLSQDAAGKIAELETFLAKGSPAQEFSSWSAWLSRFIYENLGSQIVILN